MNSLVNLYQFALMHELNIRAQGQDWRQLRILRYEREIPFAAEANSLSALFLHGLRLRIDPLISVLVKLRPATNFAFCCSESSSFARVETDPAIAGIGRGM